MLAVGRPVMPGKPSQVLAGLRAKILEALSLSLGRIALSAEETGFYFAICNFQCLTFSFLENREAGSALFLGDALGAIADSGKIAQQKGQLRQEMLALRNALSPQQRAELGQRIGTQVKALAEYKQARTVHIYVSAKNNEVPTHELIRSSLVAGKRIIVPVVDRRRKQLKHAELTCWDELKPGYWGLLEPDPKHRLLVSPAVCELVLVPGLAFDRQGGRLGFGGGYYDRFLAAVQVPRIGLAYAFQVLESVPMGVRDVRLDGVVTEKEVIRW